MNIQDIQSKIRKFVRERDWEKFHSPKNLAMALGGEAGELLELFQWLDEKESFKVMADEKSAERVKHELADIAVYVLRMCDVLSISLEDAILEKLKVNEAKYPRHLSQGNAKKYTDL